MTVMKVLNYLIEEKCMLTFFILNILEKKCGTKNRIGNKDDISIMGDEVFVWWEATEDYIAKIT